MNDVLAQPSRARLYRLLGELGRAASTDELAERAGLHPNGVRTHLERLAEAGLVLREREHRPRGRPRDRWSIDPAAGPTGPPDPYVDLSRWLVRDVAARSAPLRKVEATGRSIGRELARAAEPCSPPSERLRRELAKLGFAPVAETLADGAPAYTLTCCPYREAVHENPPVVCALHRGMTRGLLDGIDPIATLAAFVPADPDTAGCRIELGEAPVD